MFASHVSTAHWRTKHTMIRHGRIRILWLKLLVIRATLTSTDWHFNFKLSDTKHKTSLLNKSCRWLCDFSPLPAVLLRYMKEGWHDGVGPITRMSHEGSYTHPHQSTKYSRLNYSETRLPSPKYERTTRWRVHECIPSAQEINVSGAGAQ